LAGLAHADLDARVVDEGVFAADQVIFEEARIFARLPAALNLRFSDAFQL
jgi:hypothetical protein